MNRRLEDEIARLAFGDLPPARAAALERLAETDPEVKKALAAYSGLKRGLQALSPPVEHQLSSERLRREILEQGLGAPTRAAFDFRWLILPAAAAAAFFVVQGLPRLGGGANDVPLLVKAPASDDGTRVALREPDVRQPESSVTAPSVPAPVVSTAPSASRPQTGRRSQKPAASSGSGIVASSASGTRVASKSVDLRPNEALAQPAVGVASAPGAAMKAADAVPAPESFGGNVGSAGLAAAPAKRDPIVVIQPVRDAATGAFRATEVASPSNVLIGS